MFDAPNLNDYKVLRVEDMGTYIRVYATRNGIDFISPISKSEIEMNKSPEARKAMFEHRYNNGYMTERANRGMR